MSGVRRPASRADKWRGPCAGIAKPIEANGEQMKAGEDPWRTLRVVGNTDDLEPSAIYLCRDWLPASAKEARDFPIYCQPQNFFP